MYFLLTLTYSIYSYCLSLFLDLLYKLLSYFKWMIHFWLLKLLVVVLGFKCLQKVLWRPNPEPADSILMPTRAKPNFLYLQLIIAPKVARVSVFSPLVNPNNRLLVATELYIYLLWTHLFFTSSHYHLSLYHTLKWSLTSNICSDMIMMSYLIYHTCIIVYK